MAQDGIKIRGLLPEDRGSIVDIVGRIPQFTDEERSCAVELADLHINHGERSGYNFLVSLDKDDRFLGYVCFGKIPLTDACFDIYWIVVDPAYQDKGIGTQLLNEVEEKLRILGGRKIFVETSSQKKYLSAQNFYQKFGFRLISYIKDFYKVDDAKLVYCKEILN